MTFPLVFPTATGEDHGGNTNRFAAVPDPFPGLRAPALKTLIDRPSNASSINLFFNRKIVGILKNM
ncbi:hypothetical protein EG028_26255 [Chitinophaga barathri]|uniref:Uncharacterized protein n=1 Tax=Chitinophaga barathri TaxID=1647451 RepID=A0A3N4M5E4_9BACT|nr:hypothetical protein EG028_26255 [Chitinophaga barathri]